MFLTHADLTQQLKKRGVGIQRSGKIPITMEGVEFHVNNSLALKTFRRHGTTCSCCGREAVGYMLDKVVHNPKSKKKRKTVPKLTLFGYRENGTKLFFTCDHIIPKSRGGKRTSMDNVQTMCYDCNQKKGNLMPSEEVLGKNWWNNIPTIQFENEPNLYEVS